MSSRPTNEHRRYRVPEVQPALELLKQVAENMIKQTVPQKTERSLDQFQHEFLKYLCCGLQSTYSVTDVKPLVSGNCLQIDWKDGHTSTYEFVRNGLIQCTIISNFPHQRPSAHNARRYEQKAEGPGVFHGFRHNYFLGKENAIFKLRYVLSCNVMSLKVLGIV